MANEKDLNHSTGNATCQDMLNRMKPKSNTGSNKYSGGSKGPKIPTSKVVEKGWGK